MRGNECWALKTQNPLFHISRKSGAPLLREPEVSEAKYGFCAQKLLREPEASEAKYKTDWDNLFFGYALIDKQ